MRKLVKSNKRKGGIGAMSEITACLIAFALLLMFALSYFAIYRISNVESANKVTAAKELWGMFRQANTPLEKMFVAFVLSPKLLRPSFGVLLLTFLGTGIAMVFGAICNCCGITMDEIRKMLRDFYNFIEHMKEEPNPT